MSTKRVKPSFEVYTINDLNGADHVLQEIASIERELTLIELEKNESIDKVKEQAKEKAAPLLEKIDSLGKALGGYATENRKDLFKDKRSQELNFGIIGFRQSTMLKTLPKKTWDMVLDKIEEQGLSEFVSVKKTVNKEELHKKENEYLEPLGCRKVSQDTFYYVVKEDTETS